MDEVEISYFEVYQSLQYIQQEGEGPLFFYVMVVLQFFYVAHPLEQVTHCPKKEKKRCDGGKELA